MHYYFVEDERGELVALVPFCCDSCHQQWCEKNGVEYLGWNGAHEGADSAEYCAHCGVVANAGNDGCDCQRDNVVENRFPSTTGERCQHGNWLQLPAVTVDRMSY